MFCSVTGKLYFLAMNCPDFHYELLNPISLSVQIDGFYLKIQNEYELINHISPGCEEGLVYSFFYFINSASCCRQQKVAILWLLEQWPL